MSSFTKADFSRLAGVSKAAVTQAVKASRLFAAEDGQIDAAHPINASWLAMKKAGIRGSGGGATVPPPAQPTDSGRDPIVEGGNLDRAKKIADINLKRAQRDRHELAIAERKGELIPRESVKRKWSAFDAALKTNLRDLPRRSCARLHAIAVSEGERAMETAMEAEISEALKRTVEAARDQGLL